MPRAIDMHVHLPTASFLQGAIEPFVGPAEKFFRNKVPVRKMEEVAQQYAEWDIVGVLLAWDAETATGLPALTNDEVVPQVHSGSDNERGAEPASGSYPVWQRLPIYNARTMAGRF